MLHFHSHCSNTPPGVISRPQRTHNGVGIIITTFAGNSFPNRWCKSASLLLRIFCCCIFQRIQEGLFCLHMPMLPCVETSWIRVFPQLQKGKRAFTWQCYMWEHKRHLPFCNASSTGKQERTLSSASFALYHKGFLCKSFPVLLRWWAASSASSNLNRRCQEKHKYSCSGSNTEKSPH